MNDQLKRTVDMAELSPFNASVAARILLHMRKTGSVSTSEVIDTILAVMPGVDRKIIIDRVNTLRSYGCFDGEGRGSFAVIRLLEPEKALKHSIMLILRANRVAMKVREISSDIGVATSTLYRVMREMADNGEIIRTETTDGVVYAAHPSPGCRQNFSAHAAPASPRLPPAGKTRAGGDGMIRWAAGRLSVNPDALAASLRDSSRKIRLLTLARSICAT